jgi:hypothetical protein
MCYTKVGAIICPTSYWHDVTRVFYFIKVSTRFPPDDKQEPDGQQSMSTTTAWGYQPCPVNSVLIHHLQVSEHSYGPCSLGMAKSINLASIQVLRRLQSIPS